MDQEQKMKTAVMLYQMLGQVLVEADAIPLLKQIEDNGFKLALTEKKYVPKAVESFQDLFELMLGLNEFDCVEVGFGIDGSFMIEWIGDEED